MEQLKLHATYRHTETWRCLDDQGRTVAAHRGADSAFITRPCTISDYDYRFAVAARMNQLPTLAVLKRPRRGTVTRYRSRGSPQHTETMANILSQCGANNASIRAHHDRVIDGNAAQLREVERTGSVELRINQTVDQAPISSLRPDVQLVGYHHLTSASEHGRSDDHIFRELHSSGGELMEPAHQRRDTNQKQKKS
ncbi:reverse transcriptase [Phytophthora cinnamomi]|uniref:reverse transcriptase n=1 Tax=Phytophthora cinnamomi TaxID=4785 RepID=UPI00355A4A96|nr:reverse transcriptase [Phytophthora cinnamomi]